MVKNADTTPQSELGRDDDWFSEGNLNGIADFLTLCPDAETLQLLRNTYPADVLKIAAKRLDKPTFERIKQWAIELNEGALKSTQPQATQLSLLSEVA